MPMDRSSQDFISSAMVKRSFGIDEDTMDIEYYTFFKWLHVADLYAFVALFCSSILRIFSGTKRQRILPNVPIVGVIGGKKVGEARSLFRHGSKDMLLTGYEQNNGKPFYVPTPRGERLMIPPKYVEELKNEPNERADFPATFIEMFEGQYTTIGTEQTLHPRIIKNQLNQFMPSIFPEIDDEVQVALLDLLPDCRDWTEVRMNDILARTVARASSRMFGGTKLSRHEEWTNTMIDFTTDSFLAAQRLKDYPAPLRPLAKYFVPELAKVFEHFALAQKLIVPLLTEREQSKEASADLLQWMLENAEGRAKSVLSAINLHVAFAAIHTSAVAVTHIIYDLCAMPEYVQPLLEEMEAALAEGRPSKKTLLKMSKLDSFMRESQRFNPLLLITYERVAHEDLVMSDGFVIPVNTQVGVAAQAVGFNPQFYDDPLKFDGYRFHKLRESDPQSAGQQQYTAANLRNMSWGYGKHACPGRWFADAEIKVILIHLLRNYELRFPEGQSRPQSLQFETQNLPDREATVLIRKKHVE